MDGGYNPPRTVNPNKPSELHRRARVQKERASRQESQRTSVLRSPGPLSRKKQGILQKKQKQELQKQKHAFEDMIVAPWENEHSLIQKKDLEQSELDRSVRPIWANEINDYDDQLKLYVNTHDVKYPLGSSGHGENIILKKRNEQQKYYIETLAPNDADTESDKERKKQKLLQLIKWVAMHGAKHDYITTPRFFDILLGLEDKMLTEAEIKAVLPPLTEENKALQERILPPTPRLSSPKTASPREASPRISSPKRDSPRAASPRISSPKRDSPRAASPRAASPRIISPPKTSSPRKASHRPSEPVMGPPVLEDVVTQFKMKKIPSVSGKEMANDFLLEREKRKTKDNLTGFLRPDDYQRREKERKSNWFWPFTRKNLKEKTFAEQFGSKDKTLAEQYKSEKKDQIKLDPPGHKRPAAYEKERRKWQFTRTTPTNAKTPKKRRFFGLFGGRTQRKRSHRR